MEYITLDEFMKNAVPSTVLEDTRRRSDIAWHRGLPGWSDEDVARTFNTSVEEVKGISPDTSESEERERMGDVFKILPQIIGAEI